MKKKSASTEATEDLYEVYGMVRDEHQQPVAKATVRVHSKNIRHRKLIGEAVTDAAGNYAISYTPNGDAHNAIIAGVYDNKTLLKESDIHYQVPVRLQIDLDLSGKAFAGIPEYDQLVDTITPFTEGINLSEITQNEKEQDISFIIQKTGTPQNRVERLAMAARFETFSLVPAYAWYGILQQNLPRLNTTIRDQPVADFETTLEITFDALMHTPVDQLISALEHAINENIISFAVTKELPKIRKQLHAQVLTYAKQHPVSGEPSVLHQQLEIAGLNTKEIQSFIETHNSHAHVTPRFWQDVADKSVLKDAKDVDQVKAVLHLSRLTGDNLSLTEKLVKAKKIKTPADLKKLAALDQDEWHDLIKEHKVKPHAAVHGNSEAEKIKQYAAELEAAFTNRFPTAAFSARLQKDTSANIPHKEPIGKFLDQHDQFDLLHTRVGQFLTENKNALPKKDGEEITENLRRIQRIFKLSTKYDTVNTLLNDKIHSALQVYKMGEEKFVKTYGGRIGEEEAKQVFGKAANVQAASTAVVANLKSMADASALNAFPNLAKALAAQAGPDIPSLEKLFGHTDFFKTNESRSVYGIPAYLTDVLHFLNQRLSTLPLTGPRVPTAKDLMLRRRPDIGDLDLGNYNADTEVPYIDIACELMEDYIAAPAVTIASATFLAKLVKGVIDATLLSGIKTQFSAAGRSDLNDLLTPKAIVSDVYTTEHLQADNTFLVQNHWMIRDKQVVLRASIVSGAANIEIRLSHQTLLPADAISAGPEYVNPLVYNNFLKTAKRPFSLPFDLYETESELYLEKLGTKKADLIDIFSRTGPSSLHSTADLNMGYASLGINQAEQTLIFTPDISNQTLYWGTDATSTTITINTFEKLSGLNYDQIVCLLQLQFINPTKNSLIDHDDLTADTTKKRITNITPTKLDNIHRFLRLWRKTTLTMQELDAFIVIMSAQNGLGSPTLNAILADELRNFLWLQQSLELTPFELLALYGNLDITHNLPNCQYNLVYQNSSLTNPVNPNFAIDTLEAVTVNLSDTDKTVICSILQISLTELSAILSQAGISSLRSFISLSVLYKYAKLAHALEISVTEFLTLLKLINPNPFADPSATCQFIYRYRQLQSFGFSTDEVNYILRHQDNASHTLVPTVDQRAAALNQLQNDLIAIKAISTPAADPNGVLLNQWLTDGVVKWDISIVNRLTDILSTIDDDTYRQKITDNTNFLFNLRMGYQDAVLKVDLTALPVVSGAPVAIPASLTSQLSFDATTRQLVLKGVISAADRDALLALSTDGIWQAAVNALYSKIVTSSAAGNSFFTSLTDVDTQLNNLLTDHIADRFAFFINKISPVYRSLLQQNALTKNISTWFNADKKLAGIVLQYVPEVFNELTADNFVNKVIDTTTAGNPYPVQATRYQFLAKLFFTLRKLNLSVLAQDQALQLFLTNGTIMGCLDFKTLPLTTVDGSVTTYPGFEAILNLLRFDQLHPTLTIPFSTGGAGRYNIFGVLIQTASLPGDIPTALTQMKNNLAFAYGWSATDLQTLLTANFTVITDFKAASAIMLRLHKVFTTLQQLNVSLADAQSWCGFSPTVTDSAKIKNTLKAKYSSSDWQQVTTPLQNSLREKKRDALIAYLLANPGTQTWNDANDLFSYFLLDVQMCSCQPTSRIVEASNAVQLFVQRCFLSLESSVVTNASWQQWTWMKNFRVWQANVKLFLYPENYIEPELLPNDIKSSFLKDLENDLLQNEVTQINVEDAFRNYLEKLEAVARLEVKGTWYDQPARTLHVFARTYGGNPRIYYHRTFVNDKRWTPWTKIDLDITSDHIIPAMYNNRLYLFWAIITDISDKPSSNSFTVPKADANGVYTIPTPDTPKKWQIQLAFSEYKNGKWTPKKISENNDSGQLIVTQDSTFKDKTALIFTALDVPGYDYSKIFKQDHTHVDPTADAFRAKIAPAVKSNGKLVISCYYYKFVNNSSFDNNIYIGSFQLDPVKGYPITLRVNYKIQLMQANKYIERSNRKSNMVNMIDAETFEGASVTPPQNGIPGSGDGTQILVADQAGGAFGNVIPMQMDLTDRYNYMNNIYNNTFGGSFQFQLQLGSALPYFYQDRRRNYYVVNEYSNNGSYEFLYSESYDLTIKRMEEGTAAYLAKLNEVDANLGLDPGSLPVFISRYYNFHHPLVDFFIQQLFSGGIDGLMSRDTQLKGDFGYDPDPNKFNFQNYFQPVVSGFNAIYSGGLITPKPVHNGVPDNTPGYPKDDVDFNLQSGYGLYNWELFFHAPLMIAERLSQNQQFDDAERWYRYIFNPMDTSTQPTPNKYWNTRPFFLASSDDYNQQRIDSILQGVKTQLALQKNVADWRANPFQPHFIAQYRTVAYQKVAVMKYVGHLIRHGDFLFRQDTMESVNEARQLYILAAEILGPKPEVIPQVGTTALDNYFQLEKKLDDMSDALVDIENLLPLQSVKGSTTLPTSPTLQTLYFNIPMNENLIGPTGYWDLVADRLFKIRHCLNIDGTLAPLSLFAPVIDPAALVRAAAAGLDIGAVLNDMNAPLPLYRFTTMIAKATELTNEVKTLGAAMLSAMEKKDAETMALLRTGHETKLLGQVLLIKQKQIEDAQATLDSLNKQKELTTIRKNYYSGLIDEGWLVKEQAAMSLNILSVGIEAGIFVGHAIAAGTSLIPQIVAGVSGLGSPVATASEGGQQFSAAAENGARMLAALAAASDKGAAILNTVASFDRRDQEWHFQLDLANKELEQLDKQIAGAQTRHDLATQDLKNQQLQIDQSNEVTDLMHSKFTNEDLFVWMTTQLSNTYFKSYQLAYDIAKQSEHCYRYELGLDDSGYINFGYWDNLKKGLLAGEQLFYDIKKLEIAYLEQNKRELELTKPISLSQLDPTALLKLKTTGGCWINLPEEVFDMDYPGHYMRRIKSVSITIPCISGPYTTVSCKLTMTKNSVRVSGVAASDPKQYPRKLNNNLPADDPRFRDAVGSLQSIATSTAQNDSGLFELNFRDERYLPFEGAGAISMWHLELPAAVRQFDYNTISDVIIHLKYTARDGGDALRANATTSLADKINKMLDPRTGKGLMRIFSAKNDLANEWYRFLHPATPGNDQVLTLNLDESRFPLFAQGKGIKIKALELVADTAAKPINNLHYSPASATETISLTNTGTYGNWANATIDYNSTKKDPGTWTITNPAANPRLTDSNPQGTDILMKNMAIIVYYEIS